MNINAEVVGKNIARLRKEHNMTQKELANRLFVIDKTISRWECGYGYPDVTILPVIADIFGVTIDDLLSSNSIDRNNSVKEKEILNSEDNNSNNNQPNNQHKKKIGIIIAIIALITLVISVLAIFVIPLINGHSEHTCVYDQQVVSDRYRATNAGCETRATYYYSCVCGNKGTETFESGDVRGHSYTLSVEGDYKTSYKIGETFDPSNMIVTKQCLNCGDSQVVNNYTYSPTTALTASDNQISISVGDITTSIDISVASIGISNVTLLLENEHVYYAVYGTCLEGANSSTLYLELRSRYYGFVYYGKDSNILNITNNQFEIKIDVTDLPANTSWFAPVIFIDGSANNLYDETCVYHGKGNVKIGNSSYKILHTKNTNYLPIVSRVFEGTVNENATYSFVGADLTKVNERINLVYTGTCFNHTYESLSNKIKLKIRKTGANIIAEYNNTLNTTGYLTVDNNTFTLTMDVTNLQSGGNPYFTNVNTNGDSTFVDLDYLEESNVAVDKNYELNGLKYQLIYVKDSNIASEAYGCIGVKISDATI